MADQNGAASVALKLFQELHDTPHAFDFLDAVRRLECAFAELPKSFKQLRTALMKRDGGDREMADILALVLHHDEKLVEQAVREAIASGILSKTRRSRRSALPSEIRASGTTSQRELARMGIPSLPMGTIG